MKIVTERGFKEMFATLKVQVRMPNVRTYIKAGERLEIIGEYGIYYICDYEGYVLQILKENMEVENERSN